MSFSRLLGDPLRPRADPSPSRRWLVWQGRADEARVILDKLHGNSPNYSAAAEVEELVAAFELEKAIRPPGLLDVFKGSDLRRTIIAV